MLQKTSKIIVYFNHRPLPIDYNNISISWMNFSRFWNKKICFTLNLNRLCCPTRQKTYLFILKSIWWDISTVVDVNRCNWWILIRVRRIREEKSWGLHAIVYEILVFIGSNGIESASYTFAVWMTREKGSTHNVVEDYDFQCSRNIYKQSRKKWR